MTSSPLDDTELARPRLGFGGIFAALSRGIGGPQASRAGRTPSAPASTRRA